MACSHQRCHGHGRCAWQNPGQLEVFLHLQPDGSPRAWESFSCRCYQGWAGPTCQEPRPELGPEEATYSWESPAPDRLVPATIFPVLEGELCPPLVLCSSLSLLPRTYATFHSTPGEWKRPEEKHHFKTRGPLIPPDMKAAPGKVSMPKGYGCQPRALFYTSLSLRRGHRRPVQGQGVGPRRRFWLTSVKW